MRDITLCHPKLQQLAAKLLEECSSQGLQIKIGETLRTVAEQDALYAKGRTVPPIGKKYIVTNAKGSSYSSYHQWGTAFDIYRNDGQGAYNESGRFFEKVGAIGDSIGLEWGGNWKSIVDKPHFQLPDWGSSTSGIKKLYATPEEFMKTWNEKKEGWVKDDKGWWYRNADGSWPSNTWACLEWEGKKNWYYFGSDGYMLSNQVLILGKEAFVLGRDGAMMEGKITLCTNDRGALVFE